MKDLLKIGLFNYWVPLLITFGCAVFLRDLNATIDHIWPLWLGWTLGTIAVLIVLKVTKRV